MQRLFSFNEVQLSDLSVSTNCVPFRKTFFMSLRSKLSPLFHLSNSLYQFLCWSFWSIWTFLCMVLSMSLHGFFYMQPCSLTGTMCWRYLCFFFSEYFRLLLQNSNVHTCVELWPGLKFDFIDQCVSFVPIPCFFYYYSSLVWLEIVNRNPLSNYFIIQDFLSDLGIFGFPYKVENCPFKTCEESLLLVLFSKTGYRTRTLLLLWHYACLEAAMLSPWL